MSTDYDLLVASDLTPQKMLDLLSLRLSLATSDMEMEKDGVLKISVRPALRGRQTTFQEAFGFTPTLAVHFRLNKFAGYKEAMCLLIRGTIAVLTQKEADAVLLFNGEQVILERIKGHLLLDKGVFGYANYQENLAEVTMPYQMRDLRQPLL